MKKSTGKDGALRGRRCVYCGTVIHDEEKAVCPLFLSSEAFIPFFFNTTINMKLFQPTPRNTHIYMLMNAIECGTCLIGTLGRVYVCVSQALY